MLNKNEIMRKKIENIKKRTAKKYILNNSNTRMRKKIGNIGTRLKNTLRKKDIVNSLEEKNISCEIILFVEEHYNQECSVKNTHLMEKILFELFGKKQIEGKTLKLLTVNEGDGVNSCILAFFNILENQIKQYPGKTRNLEKFLNYAKKNIIVEEKYGEIEIPEGNIREIKLIDKYPNYKKINILSQLLINLGPFYIYPNEDMYMRIMGKHLEHPEKYLREGFNSILEKFGEIKTSLDNQTRIEKIKANLRSIFSNLTIKKIYKFGLNRLNEEILNILDLIIPIVTSDIKIGQLSKLIQLENALKENKNEEILDLIGCREPYNPKPDDRNLESQLRRIRDESLIERILERLDSENPPNCIVMYMGRAHYDSLSELINESPFLELNAHSIDSKNQTNLLMKRGGNLKEKNKQKNLSKKIKRISKKK